MSRSFDIFPCRILPPLTPEIFGTFSVTCFYVKATETGMEPHSLRDSILLV